MYEYIKEDTDVDDATEPSEIIADEIIADTDEITDDIFDPIDAVFNSHNLTTPTKTPPASDISKTTDEPSLLTQQTNDKLFNLLIGIAADVKEIKEDIATLKSSFHDTKTELTKKIDKVEAVTNTISEVLKKRKPSTPNIKLSTPNIKPSKPAPTNIPPPVSFISPIDIVEEQQDSFTSLLTDSMMLDDLYPSDGNENQLSPIYQPITPTNNQLAVSTEISSKPPKRKINACATFIRQQLQSLYSEEELSKGTMNGGKRKWKDTVTERDALSPHRLGKTLQLARRKFAKEELESLNINDLVNSKCRQVRFKLEKRLKNIEQ